MDIQTSLAHAHPKRWACHPSINRIECYVILSLIHAIFCSGTRLLISAYAEWILSLPTRNGSDVSFTSIAIADHCPCSVHRACETPRRGLRCEQERAQPVHRAKMWCRPVEDETDAVSIDDCDERSGPHILLLQTEDNPEDVHQRLE